MNETQELLARFVKHGSESAFREIVTRYIDLVYSTAVRLVDGDTHRAQDISQVVFADLAKMAGRLSSSTMLGGWLHRHTCFVARTFMRGERRRQVRERQAVEMNALNDQGGVLTQLAPVLDEAIQELGPDDRDVILLRFFEQRSLRSVGDALGITENVAQKRVARAVQELGRLLQRRGVTLSATVLASGLAAGAVLKAPSGLAASIAGSVFAGTQAAGGVGLASLAKTAVLLGGIIVAGVATMFLLKSPTKSNLANQAALAPQEPIQIAATSFPVSGVATEPMTTGQPSHEPRVSAETDVQTKALPTNPAGQPGAQRASAPDSVFDSPVFPVQRYTAVPGSKLRIEGSTTVHDWRMETSLIAGFLEIGTNQLPSNQTLDPGPIPARAEVFITARSLRSVNLSGRPYSDLMDEVAYAALKVGQHPRIEYRLFTLSFRGVTNVNNAENRIFESQGELVVAGVTNQLTMPVLVEPLQDGKVKISGRTSLEMTAFQVEPPIHRIAGGPDIETDNEVRVLFEWVVAPKGTRFIQLETDWVPLLLNLPSPAFKGLPRDLQLGSQVELPSETPRPPILVPRGLKNVAHGARLRSSDTNVSAESLSRITDGAKEATDESIVFLRKGRQWVQIDLGSPHEIFAVVIWHAHNNAKVYHDVIVRLADDPEFEDDVRTLFNNDSDNSSGFGVGADKEYVESYQGKLLSTQGAVGRFLRFYSNGSTESALNEYTEIEVYGRPSR